MMKQMAGGLSAIKAQWSKLKWFVTPVLAENLGMHCRVADQASQQSMKQIIQYLAQSAS